VLLVKFSLLERNNVRDGNGCVIVETVVVFRNLGCLGSNIQGRLEKLLKSERNIGRELIDILEIRSMRKMMENCDVMNCMVFISSAVETCILGLIIFICG
jgi:hypothetical protein